MSGFGRGDYVLILAKIVEVHGSDIGYSVELWSKTDQYTAMVRPDLVITTADRPAAPEADRGAIVKDTGGNLWTWDTRQQAWECISDRYVGVLTWETLDSTLGPLKVHEATA